MRTKKKNPDSGNVDLTATESLVPASRYKTPNSTPTTPVLTSQPTEKEPSQEMVADTTPIEDGMADTSPLQDTTAATGTIVASKVDTLTKPKPATKKIKLDIHSKRVSALSLSSLKAKKNHELNKKDTQIDESELPKTAFTEEEMIHHWDNYIKKIDAKGQKILASNLNADVPKLGKDHTLHIELPNGTMKKEIEREQYGLMTYLKEKLNNYAISLQIKVNEETAKKFAFTPEEKYQKLREKNPAIDLLRKEFDLDL